MTPNKRLWVTHRWRQVRHYSSRKASGQNAPFYWSINNITRTYSERFVSWLQNRQCQHYGPKARTLELFQRRDLPFLALQSGKLRMKALPPASHHNLLDAASQVGALETRLGYTFKNRMTCIQALKVTGPQIPLYFDGTIHNFGKNNRLALLGDRVLSLVVCEIWFKTEHSTREHQDMSSDTVSRAALAVAGRAVGLHEIILKSSATNVNKNHIAETFEAVLGAVYVDSNYSVEAVKDVIRRLRLDDHRFLKARGPIHPGIGEDVALYSGDVHRDIDDVRDDLLHGGEPEAPTLDRHNTQIAKRRSTRPQPLVQDLDVKAGDNAKQGEHPTGESQGKTIINNEGPPTTTTPPQAHIDSEALHAKSATVSSEAQLEIITLQSLEKRRTSERAEAVERAEAATRALRKHAMLISQGIQASPLNIFREIRAEMGRAKDRNLVAAQKAAQAERAERAMRREAKFKAYEKAEAEKKGLKVAKSQTDKKETEEFRTGQSSKADSDASRTDAKPTKSVPVTSSDKKSSDSQSQTYQNTVSRRDSSAMSKKEVSRMDKASQDKASKDKALEDKVVEPTSYKVAAHPSDLVHVERATISEKSLQQSEQGTLRDPTDTWFAPKPKVLSVPQKVDESNPKGIQFLKGIEKDNGIGPKIYETEMDLFMGGFMNNEGHEPEEIARPSDTEQNNHTLQGINDKTESHSLTSDFGTMEDIRERNEDLSYVVQMLEGGQKKEMLTILMDHNRRNVPGEKILRKWRGRTYEIALRIKLRKFQSETAAKTKLELSKMDADHRDSFQSWRQEYHDQENRLIIENPEVEDNVLKDAKQQTNNSVYRDNETSMPSVSHGVVKTLAG